MGCCVACSSAEHCHSGIDAVAGFSGTQTASFLTIFIGNLSWDAEREDLEDLFSQYGEVTKCSLPLDRETGRKRGFGFVDMRNEADEQAAINDLQDVEWMGRQIGVRKAEPRR